MTDEPDTLRESLEDAIGKPLSDGGPSIAPDAVNLPMIRHWVDALDDRNPIYLDEAAGAATRHGGLVAPPAMLQTWTMGRPRIEGIAARGGAAGDMNPQSPLAVLAAAGYRGTLATNSELEFDRYLRIGDRLQSEGALESISERKTTGLGNGYFVTWVTTYTDQHGEEVGRQRFRVLKFDPSTMGGERSAGSPPKPEPAEPTGEMLPPFELEVTPTVVVAGAIASRDFMPVHHDRDYAQAQGAPDIFMNILSTNGYCGRFLTDWAGPDALVRQLSIRLGVPVFPGSTLRFTGAVTAIEQRGDERLVHVELRAATDLGDHASGTAIVAIPA